MSREIAYFCPKCQNIDVKVARLGIVGADGEVPASCGLCGWTGKSSELVGAVTGAGDTFWDGEKVGNVMIMAIAKHGAGPLIQAMELIGILPRIPELVATPGLQEEALAAQAIKDQIMQAVIGAACAAAFETAAVLVPDHMARFKDDRAEAVGRIFSFAEHEASNDN